MSTALRLGRSTLVGVFSFFLAASVPAQVTLVHDSLTDWTHSTGGNWTNTKTEPTAEFGFVDQLNSGTVFDFTNVFNLHAGIHTVTFRVRKITSTTGREPLHVQVTINGNSRRMTLPAAAQTLDTWVTTPTFWFQVPAPDTPVTIALLNDDPTKTLRDYQFDSHRLTLITHLKHLRHQTMTKWTHVWDLPYWFDNVADAEADFGIVDWLQYVWWLEWNHSMTLQPGDYTIHFRLKKRTTNQTGMANFDFHAGANGNSFDFQGWTGHPVDVYEAGPELRFTVSAPDTSVGFWLRDISGASKSDYMFDTARINYADFRPFGAACEGADGPPVLLGDGGPQINNFFRVRIENIGASPAVAVTLGLSDTVWNGLPLPIDLGLIGMDGCKLYTDMQVTTPATISGTGFAVWGFPVPNDQALVGGVFFAQAFVLAPGANRLGVIATNAGKGIVRQ